MKNLKLLDKKYFLIILFFSLIGFGSHSEEPKDIWNIETKPKKNVEDVNTNLEEKNIQQNNCRSL